MNSISRYAIIIVVWATSCSPLAAWEFSLNAPEGSDLRIEGLVGDSQGNSFILGQSWISGNSGSNRQFVIKLFPDGTEAWRQRFDFDTEPEFLAIDNADNIYVCGRALQGPKYVIKIDGATGQMVWGSAAIGGSHHVPDDIEVGSMLVANGSVILSDGDFANPAIAAAVVLLSQETGEEQARIAMPLGPIKILMPTPSTLLTLTFDKFGLGGELRKVTTGGQLLWFRPLYQDFWTSLAIDSNGDVLAYSDRPDGQVSVRKFSGESGDPIWSRLLAVPFLAAHSDAMLIDHEQNILIAVTQVDAANDQYPYVRLLKLSGLSGEVLSESTLLNRRVTGFSSTPVGSAIAFGDSTTSVGPTTKTAWVASINDDFTEVRWERFFPAEGGDPVPGVAAFQSGMVAMAGKDVLVLGASLNDGTDIPQLCGNGVIDIGEQCDDGNDDAFDDCPSGSSHLCRYTNSAVLTRGSRTNPAKDKKSCQLEWYIVNPLNARDKYDLPNALHVCEDGDGWCDYDGAAGNCRFRVVACLNNHDAELPGCTPKGVSKVDFPLPKFKPRFGESGEDVAATLNAMLVQATNSLLDPANPGLGHTKAPPLAAEVMNACSEPMDIDVPLANQSGTPADRLVTIVARSRDASAQPRRHTAKLKLLCKAP